MTSRKHILVVDDEPLVRRVLEKYLTGAGFETSLAEDGESARKFLESRKVDLVLLDVNMPGESGLEVARYLSKSAPETGVIILTGNTDSVDRIVGLELGADDYVAKPYDERELLARIRSLLRRTSSSPQLDQRVIKFDGYKLDLDAHELRDPEDSPVSLTGHEFSALACFAARPGKVLSRDEIMNNVYGREWYPSDRSVDVLVGKLRKKLSNDNWDPIKTIRGSGYKFAPRSVQ